MEDGVGNEGTNASRADFWETMDCAFLDIWPLGFVVICDFRLDFRLDFVV